MQGQVDQLLARSTGGTVPLWRGTWRLRVAGAPLVRCLALGFTNRRSAATMWMLVGVLAVAGTALRLLHIGMDAYWRNELFSIYWIRHSYAFLMTQGLVSETNPPLHFVLLKAWTSLFGTSAIAARSLSALASVICIPLTYMLGRALGGARVGLLGAALLAASPVQIYFANEARGYALLTLFVLTALLGLCRFLSGSTLRPHGADRAATRMTGLALYAASGVALLYTHATAIFVLAALFVTMLLMFVDAGLGRARIRAFLIANAVIGLLGAPAMLAMAWQAGSPNIEWMPRFGLDQLIITVRYLLLGPLVRDDLGQFWTTAMVLAEMGLASFTAICLFAVARKAIKERLALGMLLVFPVVFLALVCAVSIVRPVLIPRVTL
jgi:mannosyltransferase